MTDKGPRESQRRDGWVVGISATAVGILVLLLLHPARGNDTLPPECFSMFGYAVPCGSGFSLGLAAAGAVVAGAVAYELTRRRRRQGQDGSSVGGASSGAAR
jgi:hypothetical protein